jgi:hypothetical protein
LCTKERRNFYTSTLQVKRELRSKHCHPPAESHDVTYQKTVICINQNINTTVTQKYCRHYKVLLSVAKNKMEVKNLYAYSERPVELQLKISYINAMNFEIFH